MKLYSTPMGFHSIWIGKHCDGNDIFMMCKWDGILNGDKDDFANWRLIDYSYKLEDSFRMLRQCKLISTDEMKDGIQRAKTELSDKKKKRENP